MLITLRRPKINEHLFKHNVRQAAGSKVKRHGDNCSKSSTNTIRNFILVFFAFFRFYYHVFYVFEDSVGRSILEKGFFLILFLVRSAVLLPTTVRLLPNGNRRRTRRAKQLSKDQQSNSDNWADKMTNKCKQQES